MAISQTLPKKRSLLLTLAVLIVLALGLIGTLGLMRQQQNSQSHAQAVAQCASPDTGDIPKASGSGSLAPLANTTTQLRQKNNNGLAALFGNPQEERQTIRDLAQKRKQYLLTAMQQDPKAAYKQILSQNDRQTIAQQTQNCVEQTASISGTLEVRIVDYKNQPDRTIYSLRTRNNKTVDLYATEGLPKKALPGSQVTAQGYMLDNSMLVDSANNANIDVTNQNVAFASNAIGDQKTVIVLINFQDTSQPVYNTSAITSTVFSDVSNFYKDVSFGKTSFSGELLSGVTKLPMNTTCTDLNGIENNVLQAIDQQVDFNTYHRVLVIGPFGPNCPWKGESMIGEAVAQTNDGTVTLSMSLVNADSTTLQIIGHELGHGLGLGHAGTLVCTPFGSSSCTLDEYADPYSIMGNLGLGMNGFDKETLGWLDPSNITTVAQSGTYTIAPLETKASGPMLLKIPTADNNFLYVEYRQPTGIDSSYQTADPNTNVYTGALLHIEEPQAKSALLLVSPNIVGLKHALQTNQSYTYLDGTKVTVTGQTGSSLTAQVTLGNGAGGTASPTSQPNQPTSVPTSTTQNPTATVTPVGNKSQTGGVPSFTVSLKLGGIDGSTQPQHPTRTVALTLSDSANTPMDLYLGSVTYDNQTHLFTGTITGSSTLPYGLYTVKVASPGYLFKIYPIAIQYSSPTNFTLPEVELTGGDVDWDLQLNVLDYQELMDCYDTTEGSAFCPEGQREAADLNDDGKVNEVDYNIFLRQLLVHNGD